MDGWTKFAEQIIEELQKYDKNNNSDYGLALSDEDGIVVLANAMRKVDKANQWEPIPQRRND